MVDLFGFAHGSNSESFCSAATATVRDAVAVDAGGEAATRRRDLGQFFTPAWAADRLIEHYYANLGCDDSVVEPSCGPGAFLAAVPSNVRAIGVEIDPQLAEQARRNTGRMVLEGDFTRIPLPVTPTLIVGNPPFASASVSAFLDRAWALLPDEGRVGFILPAYAFQSSSTVAALAKRWSIAQDALPRNLFPRLSLPLCFARFVKGARRTLVGFVLYEETEAVHALPRRYRDQLVHEIALTWGAVVKSALAALGGEATLTELYAQIEGNRPTQNRFWHAKVRQMVQRHAVRVGSGRWRLAAAQSMTSQAA